VRSKRPRPAVRNEAAEPDSPTLRDRLARVSVARLALSTVSVVVVPALFLWGELRSGHTAWAILFAVLLALGLSVLGAAVVVKAYRRNG
jgi:predicted anti-sigma-YlaC factor YlaD